MNIIPEPLMEAWQQCIAGDQHVAWTIAVTPPLPVNWPVRAGTQQKTWYYAHGFALDGHLADAVLVAAPWAVASSFADAAGQPIFEVLATRLISLGPQGIRPLAADVPAQPQPQSPVDADARLAHSYREWKANNGVIAAHLRIWHTTFFTWLDGFARQP